MVLDALGCYSLEEINHSLSISWQHPRWDADFACDPCLLLPSSSSANEASFSMAEHELTDSLGMKFSSC